MSTPKASTLQSKFGFQDDDLKTANHDEIMMWLDANIRSITESILEYKPIWKNEEIAELQARVTKAVSHDIERLRESQNRYPSSDKENLIAEFLSWQGLANPPAKPTINIKSVWEYAISGKNKFMVGFVDMVVAAQNPILSITNIKDWENNYLYLVTSGSLVTFPEWNVWEENRQFLFEVKSTLPSLGELIRQVRMYQEFVPGKFYVVAPDNKYAKQLNQQGIGFIKYPEGTISQ